MLSLIAFKNNIELFIDKYLSCCFDSPLARYRYSEATAEEHINLIKTNNQSINMRNSINNCEIDKELYDQYDII